MKLRVFGDQTVNGSVHISGAKNAALPLFAAALLSDDGLVLQNVPPLSDISTMLDLFSSFGAEYSVIETSFDSRKVSFDVSKVSNFVAPYDIVKKMRASILVLGPLVAKYGRCDVSLPGGCAIGVRPVDLHLKGLEALGATISLDNGYIKARAPHGLHGTEFEFPTVTVTGTENILMAATLSHGKTILKNVAREPEIVDLANCLNKMGAKITGQGTSTIIVEGVTSLHSTEHFVIADRIEAGTYILAAAITRGELDVLGADFKNLLPTFIESIERVGVCIQNIPNGVHISTNDKLEPIDISTAPYPGYPTDLQAQTMALLCTVDGVSNIYENIWENRFMHVAELQRLGCNISLLGSKAIVHGVKDIRGAPVMATDLRASFSLVLAGLSAHGETVIDRVYHLDRGYSCVVEKLAGCSVKVERVI